MRGKYSSDPGFLSQFARSPFATRKKSFRASTKNAVISFVEAWRAESRVRIARFHFQTEMPIESSTSAISHWRVHGNRVRLDPVWIHRDFVSAAAFPDTSPFRHTPSELARATRRRSRERRSRRNTPPVHARVLRHSRDGCLLRTRGERGMRCEQI